MTRQGKLIGAVATVAVIAGGAWLALSGGASGPQTHGQARLIEWQTLLPPEAANLSLPTGVVEHGQFPAAASGRPVNPLRPPSAEQIASTGVVEELDGTLVSLAGFVVPLGFEGTGVTEFLLVPYVGACIHVPPPPANQIVFVETAEPIEIDGLFDAVQVTGPIAVSALTTDLAEVGYRIAATQIERIRQ